MRFKDPVLIKLGVEYPVWNRLDTAPRVIVIHGWKRKPSIKAAGRVESVTWNKVSDAQMAACEALLE